MTSIIVKNLYKTAESVCSVAQCSQNSRTLGHASLSALRALGIQACLQRFAIKIAVGLRQFLSPCCLSMVILLFSTAVFPTPLRIVIDAGHGGRDSGAVAGQLLEKDLTLAMSRLLAQELESFPHMEAILLRDDDVYLKLSERVRLTRQHRADAFISLHANAWHHADVHGGMVFTLSPDSANTQIGRWLAKAENHDGMVADALGVSLHDKPNSVHRVLADLSLTAATKQSKNLGESVLAALGEVTHLHSSQPEHANFMVLKSGAIPSLLIETGFISNPQEAQKLQQPAYQRSLMKAVAQGIVQFFAADRTIMAQLPTQAERSLARIDYRVRRGDTLSQIALRFGVSQRDIRRLNGLSGVRIYRGQILEIPQPSSQSPNWYQVAYGDTLSQIAQRYGTSTAKLIAYNNLASMDILAGQQLKIPPSNEDPDTRPWHYRIVAGDTLSEIAQRYRVSTTVLIEHNHLDGRWIHPGQVIEIPQRQDVVFATHKVRYGDTLSEIAQRYRTQLAALQQVNQLADTAIYAGQKLRIPLR